jgi:hypothetical protein
LLNVSIGSKLQRNKHLEDVKAIKGPEKT